jgi:outer membrane receptor protein involved in Fe transport
MNFRFFISIAFSLFFMTTLLNAEPKKVGSLSGTLLDKETNTALDFANVMIFKKNAKAPLKGVNSDVNGLFSFEDITPGEYRIEASSVGYIPYNNSITIGTTDETSLGQIFLKANAKLLKSVEVSGIRSNMKLEIDKKVFSVDQSIASAGANASDILKDIPSVEVDAEGTISLRNSTSVTVWINGKPSGLTAENRGQVLEQMPAESIDKVEVITNPSAKFSPEGSAGIINIVLKKDRKSGYFGSIRAGINSPWGSNLGGNYNYNSSKIDVYANFGLRNETNNGDGYTKRQTYSTNALSNLIDTSYLNTDSKRSFDGNGLFFRGGFDYHLTDKHTIGLSGFGMDGSHNSDGEISYNYLNNDHILTEQRTRNSTSKMGHSNFDVSLDYKWDIGEEHSLQANISYGKRGHPNNSDYEQINYDADRKVTGSSYQKQSGPSDSQDWELKVDYTKKISDKWKVEAGLESELDLGSSDSKIYNGLPSGESWSIPTVADVANRFNNDENINAIYGTITGKVSSPFGFQLGLRAEQTSMTYKSIDLNSGISIPNDKNYIDFFPSVFLSYSLSTGNDIQLNYSKRINRPHGHSLNPFVNITDSANIQIGNPYLDPEYAHSFEMNYLKSWEKHTLSASVYHRITNQVIQEIRYLENNIMYQSPSNVTSSTASGMEFVAKNRLSKIIETTTTFNFYNATMDGFSYRGIDYAGTSGFSWNARLNGNLTFTKGFSGQIAGNYSAPRIIAQGETKAGYSLDLGLLKTFFDRKFMLSINARNVLNSFKFENSTWGQGFYQETSNQFFSRNIRVNLTWNFGNMKPKVKPGKGEGNDNSMEIGGE